MHTDDAAGGRRGLRASPSPALFATVQDRYGIHCTDGVDLGGSSSLNLRLAAGNHAYVLRVYRPYVTATRLGAINRVRRELSVHGVPCAELIPTQDNQAWITFEGRLVEVERYVEHDARMDSGERLLAGLPTLGRIHAILNKIKVGPSGQQPLFANHIAPAAVVTGTQRGVERIRGWGSTPPELRLAANAEKLARLVQAAEQNFAREQPSQLVHGDFWDNNVFFREGDVVLVADFDFMGERARIDDLALTLYFTCLEYPEQLTPDQHLRRLRTLVDAYESGLRDPLTRKERLALPVAMARQPLWSIGGWVATLDDEEAARTHAAATYAEVEWALRLMHGLERWQAGLA